FALERVGLPQPRPLGGEPAVGVGQFLRARGDALLEARVRPLQLLVQNDVVEGDGEAGSKKIDKGGGCGGGGGAGVVDRGRLAGAHGPDVEDRSTQREFMVAAGERLLDETSQVMF